MHAGAPKTSIRPTNSSHLKQIPWPTLRILWAVTLSVWLVAIYSPSLSGPYLFDDRANIVNHPAIESFPPSLPWLHAESRPLVMLTFSFEKAMFGNWPAAHRIGNLFIHTLASILLAELVYRLACLRSASTSLAGSTAASLSSAPAAMVAITVATLWAVHPLASQAIAYIVQRCESLMGLFYFAFLLSIVIHRQTSQRRWLAIGAVCFLCGLWSKTVMVTGLAVGPLLDRAWLCNSWREVFAKRSALYAPPMFAAAIAVLTLMPGILRGDANVGFGGEAPPVLPYAAAQAFVLAKYIALAVLPVGLNIDHGLVAPDPWTTNLGWMVAVGFIVVLALAACFWGHWKRGFFLLAPLLILAPTSSLVPTADLLVEHRMYVPLAVIVAGIVVSLSRLPARRITLVTAVAIGVLLSLLTYERSSDYRSGMRLWFASLEDNPANARAAQNLTNAAGEENREIELLETFTLLVGQAQRSGQPTGVLLGRIGEELVKRGDAAAAAEPLRQAIDQDPKPYELAGRFYTPSDRQEFASHHVTLALALMQLDQPESAANHLQQSFIISDASADARAIAGDLDWRLGRPDSAVRHLQRALELRPGWREVKQQLAQITSP